MTKKTETDESRRSQMRQRLETPTQGRNRENSVAGDVRALDGEIARQRALGKPWGEIAMNMYEDPEKSDAVRAAFARLHSTSRKSIPVRRISGSGTLPTHEAITSGALPVIHGEPAVKQANLFGPVHDPLDKEV